MAIHKRKQYQIDPPVTVEAGDTVLISTRDAAASHYNSDGELIDTHQLTPAEEEQR